LIYQFKYVIVIQKSKEITRISSHKHQIISKYGNYYIFDLLLFVLD